MTEEEIELDEVKKELAEAKDKINDLEELLKDAKNTFDGIADEARQALRRF
jgi:archaellum component FlaC